MANFRLNFGGLFGAIICIGGVVAIFYIMGRFPPGGGKLIMLAAAGGGILGNTLWRFSYTAPSAEPPTGTSG